ncbi:MAG: HEAT repeat domain-containing protein [Ardenticatenales bacterium]|nr:HEAT repeat domain-containing protein [Ardenticatenales bacterium]
MQKEELATLIEKVAAGEDEAQERLLDHIMAQPAGIRALALAALEEGGADAHEQLMLTLAADPALLLDTIDSQGGATTPQSNPRAAEARRPPQILLATLGSGERQARVQAARALAEYPDTATVSALTAAIRSRDRQVAAAAVDALQRLGERAVPELVSVLRDPDEQSRWFAAKALAPIANEQAVPALLEALEDRNYGIRWLAAEGLAQAGTATLGPLLRRLAEERTSAWLRQGAWHALNKLHLADDEERAHYKQLAETVKGSPAAAIPDLMHQELRRLGEM